LSANDQGEFAFQIPTGVAGAQFLTLWGAWDAFRSSSEKAAHMAWTMEKDNAHVTNITSGNLESYWTDVKQSGNHFNLLFHEDTFDKVFGLNIKEQIDVLYESINLYILDTSANFDLFEAALEFFLNDLPDKVAIPIDVIDYTYQVAKNNESPLTVAFEKGIGHIPGINYLYSLFGNLATQQDAYDIAMRQSSTPYPFR
jgi:hypothetical protein